MTVKKVNTRSWLLLTGFVLMLFSGCKDMKLDIQDLKDRLDTIEGTSIASIDEQIAAISTSIDDLKNMDAALNGYIKTLETTAADLQSQINDANAEIAKVKSEIGDEITTLEQSLLNELTIVKEAIEAELTAINATLNELKSADSALDKRIEDLQAYSDSQLGEIKDWASATFSTLEQYDETQTEIAAIKASIEQTNQFLVNLENILTEKITTEIKTIIDELRAEQSVDYITIIVNSINTVTEAYTSSISSAKEELTIAYTTAVSSAITDSEASMKAWVNEQLTSGYYDIATLDGMLSALLARLDETDAHLKEQITEQEAALETAKSELTDAYKTAIKNAISENNGIINAAIAEAVQNLDNKIQERLIVINTDISNIQKQLTNISKDIASIFEQIANISSSISDLQDVDRELDAYVKSLESGLAALREEFESLKPVDEPTKDALEKDITDLKTLIQALQTKDTELETLINNLQTYTDTELQKTTDWANATFATLEQYSAVQTEISAIKTLINKTKEEVTEEYTAAIEIAISNCETDMKAWVNALLAQGYYNISAIDGKVSALETLISDGDINLQNQIDEQKTALQQAKSDLTKEYIQYIDQAIAAGGIIDSAIAAQVKTAQDNLQAQIDVINGRLDNLEDRVGKLEEGFVNRIQSLKYIPKYSDGKATMDYYSKTAKLDFLISPKSAVTELSKVWNEVLFIMAFHTQTRTVTFTELPIIDYYGDVNSGIISLTVSGKNLDEKFYSEHQEICILVQISDGNSDLYSEYIELVSYRTDIIEFEDKAIEKICVTHWDTDNDRKISYEEAVKVTDIDSFFTVFEIEGTNSGSTPICLGNSLIQSFSAFRYFTGVTSISGKAFTYDINLSKICLPASISKIEDGKRYNTPADKWSDYGYWYSGAFAYTGLSSIELPEDLVYIGDYTFMGCLSLKSVFCKATVPPEIGDDVFDLESNVIIYVPHEAVDNYKTKWTQYSSRIVGYDL